MKSGKKDVTPQRSNYSNDPPVSAGSLGWIIAGILLLIVVVHIGFAQTYIRFFPDFNGFQAAQHFHGMMMIGWLLMLLVQPFLILKGKTKLHRQIGMLSYVLAPMILLSMYLVISSRYDIYLEQVGQSKGIMAWISLNFRLMVFFAILYLLGVYYRHRPALHMRYMLSTAFLLIGPGLVRVLMSYPQFENVDGHAFDRNANVLIVGIITVIDSWRTKKLSPFSLVLAFMVIQKVLWDQRDARILQDMGQAIARLF